MRREYVMLVVATFIWGSGHPIVKLILADLTPIQISMMSSALGALAVAIGLLVTRQSGNLAQLHGRGLSLALLSGTIMFFLYPMLSFSALQKIPASANSILVATSTIFVALLSPIFLKEKLNSKGIAAVVISFVGVPLVVLSTAGVTMDLSALNLVGCSLSLLGAIASASYAIIGRRIMSALDALSVTLVGSLLGAALLAVAVAVTSGFDKIGHAPLTTYVLMGYWGIFSGLAYTMFYYSLKKNGYTHFDIWSRD
jgi:drug/metabolite transporter (DMT)-like permease